MPAAIAGATSDAGTGFPASPARAGGWTPFSAASARAAIAFW